MLLSSGEGAEDLLSGFYEKSTDVHVVGVVYVYGSGVERMRLEGLVGGKEYVEIFDDDHLVVVGDNEEVDL